MLSEGAAAVEQPEAQTAMIITGQSGAASAAQTIGLLPPLLAEGTAYNAVEVVTAGTVAQTETTVAASQEHNRNMQQRRRGGAALQRSGADSTTDKGQGG